MNFAILNNNTVSTFDNNIIGFPSTNDHQFVLTRENNNGTVKYSWNKPLSVTDIDFTTQNAEYFLTTSIINLDLKGNLIVLDIEITDIVNLSNKYDNVIIYVNSIPTKITPWNKYQQIIIDPEQNTVNPDNELIEISSNITEKYIQLKQIHYM